MAIATSRQAIAEIKKTLSPRHRFATWRLRTISDDHAGGIRTYIAEGTTLIGLPAEKTFFEKVTKNVFSIDPDALALTPRPLKWESIVDGKRVLTDGTYDGRIDGHRFRSAYRSDAGRVFSNEKLIFQGDLLNLRRTTIRRRLTIPPCISSNWLEFDQARCPCALSAFTARRRHEMNCGKGWPTNSRRAGIEQTVAFVQTDLCFVQYSPPPGA
jgi:hypothetical protein